MASRSKSATILTSMISGILLLVLGLSVSGVVNTTITQMTTGENATALGPASVSMWGMVSIALAVLLLSISLGMAWQGMRGGMGK